MKDVIVIEYDYSGDEQYLGFNKFAEVLKKYKIKKKSGEYICEFDYSDWQRGVAQRITILVEKRGKMKPLFIDFDDFDGDGVEEYIEEVL